MTCHHSYPPLCSPASRCSCSEAPNTGSSTPSPTYSSSYNDALALSPSRQVLGTPGMYEAIVSLSSLVLFWPVSEIFTTYYICIGFPQNNDPPLSPSATGSVTRHSLARNHGRTRFYPDSMQPAPEYARTDLSQLSCIRRPPFVGFSVSPSSTTDGRRDVNAGHEGVYPFPFLAGGGSKRRQSTDIELRSTENPTPWQAGAGATYDHDLHPNANTNTRNWSRTSGSPNLTPGLPGRSLISSISPQSPETPQVTQGTHCTSSSMNTRGNPSRNTVNETLDQPLRKIGEWLSKHEYLNTGQEPIIGQGCPLEADLLGIKGLTVFTAFFDHTDMATFTCYVCSKISYDLDDAIRHQRRAMHHQD